MTAVLVPIVDLVAGDAADTELAAQRRHLPAFEEPGYET